MAAAIFRKMRYCDLRKYARVYAWHSMQLSTYNCGFQGNRLQGQIRFEALYCASRDRLLRTYMKTTISNADNDSFILQVTGTKRASIYASMPIECREIDSFPAAVLSVKEEEKEGTVLHRSEVETDTIPAIITVAGNADLHRERQPAIKVHGFHADVLKFTQLIINRLCIANNSIRRSTSKSNNCMYNEKHFIMRACRFLRLIDNNEMINRNKTNAITKIKKLTVYEKSHILSFSFTIFLEGPPRISAKRKKKSKPVIPPKPERFLPYTVAQNGQIGRDGSATGSVHGLVDRDIGGRSAGYGSPEVGGPSPPTRSTLLDSIVDVIHDMIRSYVELFHGRIETQHLRKIAVTLLLLVTRISQINDFGPFHNSPRKREELCVKRSHQYSHTTASVKPFEFRTAEAAGSNNKYVDTECKI
ncbi:hypothetical protein EAG_12398 [Camponotus floridanus]|uniref:Uncharacterized protein n=1 Tax=Camponotus floridanus TaxID=104421 RepID=E2AWD5_CAMFO|nr:hypothetical protein EAG_12398 [Camponotus floridanus]